MATPLRLLAAVGLALGLGAADAPAAIIGGTVDFIVVGFQTNDPSAPQDTLAGSVSILLDTAASVTDVTTGISLISLNFTGDSTVAFSYDAGTDILSIGGIAAGVSALDIPNADYLVSIQGLFSGGSPLVLDAQYSTSNPVGAFIGETAGGRASFTVPEPTTLALLGAGLIGLAATRRRRR